MDELVFVQAYLVLAKTFALKSPIFQQLMVAFVQQPLFLQTLGFISKGSSKMLGVGEMDLCLYSNPVSSPASK